MDINTAILVTTLNANILNSSSKRLKWSRFKKQQLYIAYKRYSLCVRTQSDWKRNVEKWQPETLTKRKCCYINKTQSKPQSQSTSGDKRAILKYLRSQFNMKMLQYQIPYVCA